MPRDPANRLIRTARAVRSRTDDLVREIDESTGSAGWSRLLRSRNALLSGIVWAVFTLLVGAVVVITREQPTVAPGRVMFTTRVARAEFTLINEIATDQLRASARITTPRVCVLVAGALDEVTASLENLPLVVQAASTVDEVDPEIRKQFGLTPAALQALHGQMVDGKVSTAWTDRVRRLRDELVRTPILSDDDFAAVSKEATRIELRLPPPDGPSDPAGVPPLPGAIARPDPGRILEIPTASALQTGSQRLRQDLRGLVAAAGFTGDLADAVTTRLTSPLRPTFAHDGDATAQRQQEAQARIVPVRATFKPGEVIYKRGEILRQADYDRLVALMQAERESLSWWRVWSKRAAILALVGAIGAAVAGYSALFVPRVRRSPMRTLAVAGLLAAATVIGCWGTIAAPGLIAITAVAPTVFAAIILAVAYQQRVALAYGALHGVLMCIALDQPVGAYAILVAGVGVAVWQLKEIRDRSALTRAGVAVAAALAIGTFVVSLVELPVTREAINQAWRDALFAGIGGFIVSGLVLFLLPWLERAFGLVTGIKLIELRDPKEPLLRQLQQRAPGTYNHSLTIASLGEAAAEAIGADGLLTYVGALYHDIGKMNKPDYFVENQAPGFNRHDRLSPAMSLLIIVGHVKDGMELAREFGLPRPLHHFIESHHGTTLVEYFFHRAKRRAEAAAARAGSPAAAGEGEEHEDAEIPEEIEYRYPGPRPRTKEAAIIMLCDAVESASRTMADPTPARIDQLVRTIANKRLMDGQFDECDLTLRELNTIVETVSKTLASIYHGRIQYPGGSAAGDAAPLADTSKTQPAVPAPPSPANGSASRERSGAAAG